jgi:hypothetical protein
MSLAFTDEALRVFYRGTVEDENHANVTSFVPAVLESFLGHSIQQVCCGGQHAALLTTAGHIYT